MEKKKHIFEIQLNSISDTDNPTKSEVEFFLHDFNVSHNKAFIAKETAQKVLSSLNGMPIVAKYYEKSSTESNDDALGGHEMQLTKDRDTGNAIVTMGTMPIGVFTEDAYITTTTDSEGNEVEVVAGKGILWTSRFPNVVGLLKEWIDEGITVSTSMEILYDSYKVEDGITEVLNFVYEGNCILNSSDRGEHKKIYPAYDESKITKLIAEAITQDKNEEGENMEKFKKVFELSHGDIRSLIYNSLDPTLGENTCSYIADVYENYFIANLYSWDEDNSFDKYFKYNYTNENDKVVVDIESKKEVFLKRNWEEVVPEEIQAQLNEKEEQIETLEKQVNSVKESKEEIEGKFNKASETIVQLNSKVEELKPFQEQVQKESFEKALEEKQTFYSAKFEALGAVEKFKEEEIQELVKKAIYEDETGKDAKLQLNSILVDMVTLDEKENESATFRELSSIRENLIPAADDFESRYSN
ncbi:hypothetical protein [Cytobacillus kochii]|uniref:hypothetical protein n=1 Tax=Cytobacillus kochii TaxID=859143 RepID=UPI0021E5B1F4